MNDNEYKYLIISSEEVLSENELLTRLSYEFNEQFNDLHEAFLWLEQNRKHETLCDILVLNE